MASAAANFAKKMQALRVEADEHQAKSEELQARVKTLEQETLAKEQEITSLTHRNQLLEGEVEKLETGLKEAKDAAGQSAQHGQQNESLQRRLQLLEEEAEEADKTLRETNDKYEMTRILAKPQDITQAFPANLFKPDSAKPTSRPATTNAKSRRWRWNVTTGRPSLRKCPRSTRRCRRSCRSWRSAWATSSD
jgi:DNA repair ATPase RecN